MAQSVIISVVMPVYNSEKYLKAAIDSILAQTYRDFEFIIINDGSGDSSEEIIRSFNDDRIIYVKNEKNLGLITSLNNGIMLAKGKFIARMDADDVSLPQRFEVQLRYFESNKKAALVCSPALGINLKGESRKGWDADLNNKSPEQILNTLSKENCIVHPSVMIKTEVAKKYGYRLAQKGSEDWDLWMRMASDRLILVKTEELLLKYRFNPSGITISDNIQKKVELKVIRVKWVFLLKQFLSLKWGIFEWKVLYSLCRSIARHLKLNWGPSMLRNAKRWFTIPPFAAAQQFGRLKHTISQMSQVDLFFFFPYAHIGGAEKVHASIVSVFSSKKSMVFITGISSGKGFLPLFEKEAPTLNVGYCLNHPLFRRRSEKLIFDLIKKQFKPVVFGCNNVFFYQAIFRLNKHVRIFDLWHDFIFDELRCYDTGTFVANTFEARIFISNKAKTNMENYYRFLEVEPEEFEKLVLIPNYTTLPPNLPAKNEELKVLYVGRAGAEKRVHMIGKLASICKTAGLKVTFTAIGDLEKGIATEDKNALTLTGPIYDFKQLENYYNSHHVIMITSLSEGFPLTIMEGMAHGLIPLSTPVGDVPLHVTKESGYVTSSLNETPVLTEMKIALMELVNNPDKRNTMAQNAYNYAKAHFSRENFEKAYRKLIDL